MPTQTSSSALVDPAEPTSASPSEAPRSGVRVAPKVPRPLALRAIPPPPAAPPSSRAAVKPRSTRPVAVAPSSAPVAPVSSRAQYFSSLTQTREDWPIVPASSSVTPPAPPTFGANPAPVDNPRHSLPAFLPPQTMSVPPRGVERAAERAANDQAVIVEPQGIEPVVIDEVVLPLQKTRLGGPWLFGLGVVAGALLTWLVQSM